MRYLSVCSGIEAATQAWHPLGWTPLAFSEIEAFPSEVLAHHYPDVPNLGDMTRYREWDLDPADVDVLVGGTPCQSFSVAGLRKGLDDPRGNLALVYLGIADRFRPDWIVWENVPGVLSSSGGRDFGAFLGGLAELGYGFAYRVLDAQYVRVESHPRAVPQRRRRVFVVGHSGDWRRAAAVLFEREGMSGHSPPRREAGKGSAQRVAGSLGSSGGAQRGWNNDLDGSGAFIPTAPALTGSGRGVERVGESRGQDPVVAEVGPSIGASGPPYQANAEITHDLAPTLNTNRDGAPIAFANKGHHGTMKQVQASDPLRAKGGDTGHGGESLVAFDTTQATSKANYSRPKPGDPCHPLAAGAHPPAVAFHGSQDPDPSGDVTHPVGRNQGLETCVAFSSKDHGGDATEDTSPTLRAMNHDGSHQNAGGQVAVARAMAVRRLTPRECERLQGFPRDFTRIPWRGKPASECPDGHRYRALGNSMAVNCMRWLGERMAMVEEVES